MVAGLPELLMGDASDISTKSLCTWPPLQTALAMFIMSELLVKTNKAFNKKRRRRLALVSAS